MKNSNWLEITEIVLRLSETLLRRFANPRNRSGFIFAHSFAVIQRHAQLILRARITLIGLGPKLRDVLRSSGDAGQCQHKRQRQRQANQVVFCRSRSLPFASLVPNVCCDALRGLFAYLIADGEILMVVVGFDDGHGVLMAPAGHDCRCPRGGARSRHCTAPSSPR